MIEEQDFEDGKYEGNMFCGERHGTGKMMYDNGEVYVGDWENNKRHGKGKFTWSNGISYDGSYENDEIEGDGTYNYPNGDNDITASFEKFAGYLSAISVGANIPTSLSVQHFIAYGFKTCLAIGRESGYSFRQLESAMNSVSNVAANTKAVIEEESEEEDMNLAFFGFNKRWILLN